MRTVVERIIAAMLVVLASVLVPPAPAGATVAWNPGKVYRIMPLGDSITKGVGDPHRRGYRMRLAQHLRHAGVKTNFVGSQHQGDPLSPVIRDPDHEGHGGYTIAELQAGARGWVRTYKPDVVLLMAGTNDMIRNEAPATAHLRVGKLIATIRAARPGVVVFVSRIIGVHSAEPAVEARIVSFNRQLAKLPVISAANRVYLVDNSDIASITNYDMMLWDRHHPNEYGYERMAYRFYVAMDAVFTGRWPTVANPGLYYSVEACRSALNPPRGCLRYERGYATTGTIVWVRV